MATLTPERVDLGPNADKELVIVVCKDAEGETHNHYIRDAELRASLGTMEKEVAVEHTSTRQRHADEITELANRQGAEISEMKTRHDAVRAEAHAPVLQRAVAELAEAEEKAAAAKAEVAVEE